MARLGMARNKEQGKVWYGPAWLGTAWHGTRQNNLKQGKIKKEYDNATVQSNFDRGYPIFDARR